VQLLHRHADSAGRLVKSFKQLVQQHPQHTTGLMPAAQEGEGLATA